MQNQTILVGRKSRPNHAQAASFVHYQNEEVLDDGLIDFDGSSHIVTIAPTGSGKGVSSIIPNLLTYDGPIITLDPKGEQLAVTRRRRLEMGHKVVVLDPFKVTKYKSDKLNPLDIGKLRCFDPDDDSFLLASMLSDGGMISDDKFWDRHATNIIGAMINYNWQFDEKERQNITTVRDAINEDLSYDLAVKLDTKGNLPRSISSAFKGYLSAPSERTRPSIDATAASYFTSLYSRNLEAFFSKTTFRLMDIVEGKKTDIYIVMPPDKLGSHSQVTKLILSTLFKAVLSRQQNYPLKTLFILDECATLGNFKLLETMIALCRGYDVTIHSLWQDLSQMRSLYPHSYNSILNNSAIWQFFGLEKYNSALDAHRISGFGSTDFLKMKEDEQYLQVRKNVYTNAKRLNYLTDKEFEGLFDANPFHNYNLFI